MARVSRMKGRDGGEDADGCEEGGVDVLRLDGWRGISLDGGEEEDEGDDGEEDAGDLEESGEDAHG